eukprot:m.110653 g.110653  ORF g.110653 m.110653 type:complete len:73 (+) comp16988_c0_seq4:137-355(+)
MWVVAPVNRWEQSTDGERQWAPWTTTPFDVSKLKPAPPPQVHRHAAVRVPERRVVQPPARPWVEGRHGPLPG